MRALETGRLDPDDDRLQKEASFCLGCRACEPVCPAGVQYGHLLETWRDHQWRGRAPPAAGPGADDGRRPQAADPADRRGPPARAYPRDACGTRTSGAPSRNGATPDTPLTLMLGCFERGLFPGVSRAVQKLLPEIAVPENQGCCGALHAHNGDSAGGVALAEKLGEELPGVIVTTAGGCAAHLATVLGRDRVHELSEHLVKAGYEPIGELTVDDGHGGRRRARVAIQDSCHLRNGLGVSAEPRALLGAVADFVSVAGDGSCCGSAGTYSLLRPKDARRVLDPKLDAVEAAGRRLPRGGQPGLPAPVADGAGPAQEPDPRRAPGRPAGRGGGRAAAADGAADGGPAPAGPPAVRAAGAAGVPAPQGRRPRRARDGWSA